MKQENSYEIIIIGGSYAGLAAAMALGRAMRKVLVIDSGNPCNKQTPYSHNFLTNDGRPPGEIARIAREQVKTYKTVNFFEGYVIKGRRINPGFEVQLQGGETFSATKLVFATGIRDIFPAIPGFAECWGISALHCPYCHGYEVRHQATGILANGEDAFEMATLLSNWTKELTVYTNGVSNISPRQLNLLHEQGIGIVETEIQEIKHNSGYIEHLLLRDGSKAGLKALYAKLPFAQHSTLPQLMDCEITVDGYIKVDAAQRTSVKGIYACGDNVARMRTVANAVAMGTTAGMILNKDITEEEFISTRFNLPVRESS